MKQKQCRCGAYVYSDEVMCENGHRQWPAYLRYLAVYVMRRTVKPAILLLLLAAIVVGGYEGWQHQGRLRSFAQSVRHPSPDGTSEARAVASWTPSSATGTAVAPTSSLRTTPAAGSVVPSASPTSVGVAAAGEHVAVPFANGRIATTTARSYRGRVAIIVTGTGQAAGPQKSDAFYIFTDLSGKERSPEYDDDFALWINEQPAATLLTRAPTYRTDHTYTFIIEATGTPITFAIGDTSTLDNTGTLDIVIVPVS